MGINSCNAAIIPVPSQANAEDMKFVIQYIRGTAILLNREVRISMQRNSEVRMVHLGSIQGALLFLFEIKCVYPAVRENSRVFMFTL